MRLFQVVVQKGEAGGPREEGWPRKMDNERIGMRNSTGPRGDEKWSMEIPSNSIV